MRPIRSLDQTQQQKADGRDRPHLLDRRQEAEGRGGQADADGGHQHGPFAAVHIGIMAEHHRADRPHQQGHGEGGINRRQRPGGVAGGEEQGSDHGSHIEQDEQIEQIEQIERPSQHRTDDRIDHLFAVDRQRLRSGHHGVTARHRDSSCFLGLCFPFLDRRSKRCDQNPVKLGLRFSWNASTPSLKSADCRRRL